MIAALIVCAMTEAGFRCVEVRRHVQASLCAHAVIEWEDATRYVLGQEIGPENVLSVTGRCLPMETDL